MAECLAGLKCANVGIGTTNPSQKLTVAGIVESTSGGIKFPDGTVQTTSASGSGGTNGLGSWQTKSTDTIYQASTDGMVVATLDRTGSYGFIAGYTDSSSAPTTIRGYASVGSGSSVVYNSSLSMPVKAGDYWKVTSTAGGTTTLNWIPMSSGADSMWQASSANLYYSAGNVGIGTTTPDATLKLYNSSANYIGFDAPASTWRGIDFRTAGSMRWKIEVDNATESGSDVGSDLKFTRYNDSGAFQNYPMMIQRSTGNIGIGTTSPGSILHLANSAPHITYEETDTTQKFFIGVDARQMFIRQGTTANTDLLSIKNNGNVGIGTTSPLEKLDLNGGNIKMGWERNATNCPSASTCSLSCSAGKQLLSGGCGVANNYLRGNYPSADSTWTCNTDGTLVYIAVYVICANIK